MRDSENFESEYTDRNGNQERNGTLVLTVKKNEMISIGDNIVITFKEYSFNQIRMAIVAPKSVKISRLGEYKGR